MATLLEHTVMPSGGDYTTLDAAFNHLVASHANLVTADVYAEIKIDGEWSSVDGPTGLLALSGLTTDATRFLRIYTTATARHHGAWSTSHYIRQDDNFVLQFSSPFTVLDGLQVESTGTFTNYIISTTTAATTVTIKNCLIKGTSSYQGIYLAASSGNYYLFNTVLYGIGGAYGIRVDNYGGEHLRISSCAIIGAGTYGLRNGSSTTITAKNCYVGGYGDDYSTGGTMNKTTCASADDTGSTGLQTIAVNTTNFTNVSAGTEDFHLPLGSALIDVGTDTSGDAAPMNFTTDIDGETRSGTWDIGADEYVAAVSTLSINVADAVTIAEAIVLLIPTLFASGSDAITVAEALAASPDAVFVDVADAVTTTEALSVRLADIGISVADTLTTGEAVTLLIPEIFVSVADTVAVAESVSGFPDSIFVSATDAVAVAEAVAVSPDVFSVSVSEAVAVAEAVTAFPDRIFVGASDAIVVAEAVTAFPDNIFAVGSDAVVVAESVTAFPHSIFVSAADAVAVVDTPTVATEEIVTEEISVSDAVSVVDSPTVSVDAFFLSVADAVTVADIPNVLSAVEEVRVSDSVAVLDTPTVIIGNYTVNVSDSIAVVDTPTVEISYTSATSITAFPPRIKAWPVPPSSGATLAQVVEYEKRLSTALAESESARVADPLYGLTDTSSSNKVVGVNQSNTKWEYKTIEAGTGIGVSNSANSVVITNTSIGNTDHAALDNLTYVGSGHTGFATSAHTHYVATGSDTLSTAVAAMSDGAVLFLGPGTYTQTASIKIPNAVTTFSIIGMGIGVTTIDFTGDTDGFEYVTATTRAYQAKLQGFSMTMSGTSSAKIAIDLLGSTDTGTVNPNIIVRDVSMERTATTKYWGTGIRITNSYNTLIENCYFRGKPWDDGGPDGDAIVLRSCIIGKIIGGGLFEADNAITLAKATDAEIYGANKHGTEGVRISHVSVSLSNRGIYLGTDTLDNSIFDSNLDPVYINAFEEGADSDGYNLIRGCWCGWQTSTGVSSHMIYINADGTRAIDNTLTLSEAVQNGIVVADAAEYVDISHNLIRSIQEGAQGIWLAHGHKCMVSHNKFQGTSAGAGTSDILLSAGSDSNMVCDNLIDDAITDSGASNTLDNNVTV